MDILIYWYIDTSKMLVFRSEYVYFWHPDNKNIDLSLVFYVFCAFRDGVWDSWLGLAGLPGRARRGSPRASEEQKTLKNLAKMARQFPGLYVFLYSVDLVNAKYTFLAGKRVRHFCGHPTAHSPISLFFARTPKRQALFGELKRDSCPQKPKPPRSWRL